jgi:hypothetical protein
MVGAFALLLVLEAGDARAHTCGDINRRVWSLLDRAAARYFERPRRLVAGRQSGDVGTTTTCPLRPIADYDLVGNWYSAGSRRTPPED